MVGPVQRDQGDLGPRLLDRTSSIAGHPASPARPPESARLPFWPVTPDIRRIEVDDVASATVSAARAFYDDPVLGWFQPKLVRQQRGLVRPMGAMIADCLGAGEVWVSVVDGRARGVAAWLLPGRYPRGVGRDLRLGLRSLPAFLPLSARSLPGIRLAVAIERAHPHHPHWYLSLLAVDPLLQGRGLGTALLGPVLARADAEALSVYLETQKPENLTWYARSGFAVSEELRVGPCPPVWGLTREPRVET